MSKHKYTKATDLLNDLTDDRSLVDELTEQVRRRRLMKHLIAHRVGSNLSQDDVAKHMGCTQSRISKLEATDDEDLRLGDIEQYLDTLGLSLTMMITKKQSNAVDQIKTHAFRIKHLLQSLVSLVDDDDDELADGIAKFACIEAPINLLEMVFDSISHLPQSVLERLPLARDIESCTACEDESTYNEGKEISDDQTNSSDFRR